MIPCAIKATTVIMLLVFTSISRLFQFSPNNTSSLKCANSGANSPKALRPAVCVIFAIIFCPPVSTRYTVRPGIPMHRLSSSCDFRRYDYKVATQLSICCLLALLRSLPSTIVAPGADGSSSFTVLPNPLPPDVAKSTIFLPVKSYFSRNV